MPEINGRFHTIPIDSFRVPLSRKFSINGLVFSYYQTKKAKLHQPDYACSLYKINVPARKFLPVLSYLKIPQFSSREETYDRFHT